ncbi:hypothetical protein FK531_15310 [Rhodococcus spelaei]|uniref:HTH luxR-type domain-containing protein n=1 Tax=Rhodococcus spelaei TaxID=2546320 RepID=A0A541B7Z7_9NOCA|nr:LuxR C-terminal-related transcriptional regulator [Rhodococcus spelaei]TQF68439.1 hypothetical protein FK531_15310 [Rhodococcus spelaei]
MVPVNAAAARPRLFSMLDESRLTVLWGPAGYGKATLVEAWLAARPGRPAIRRASPEPEIAADQYWSETVRAVRADTDVLVLYRPDQLSDAGIWERLLAIHEDHPGLSIVVTLRDGGLVEAVRFADPNVTVVTPAELEFTEAEVGDLLERGGTSTSDRTARDVHRITGGHPDLVSLAERVLRVFGSDADLERERAFLAVQTQIDAYVERVLLSPPRVAAAARTIAMVRRPSPGALEVLGVDDAAGTLGDLERAGLLQRMPAAPDPYWVWPAALRRSVVRIVVRDEDVPLRAASAKLARWFADNGDPVEALRYATDSRDWILLSEILTVDWPTIVTTGMGTLVRALSALPEAVVRSDPALSYARLLVDGLGLTGRGGRMRPVPDISVVEIAEQDSAVRALLTGALRLCVMRWNGDYDAAVRDRDVLVNLAMCAGDGFGELDRRGLASIWMHLGLVSQLRGDHAQTVELLTRAVDTGSDDLGNFAARQAAGQLALHHAVLGEPGRASSWLRREARFGDRAGSLAPVIELPAIAARALERLDCLDIGAAEAALADLDDSDEFSENWAFVAYASSQLDLMRGRPEVGLDRLRRDRDRFRRWLGPGAFAGPLLGAASMDLRTALGEAAQVLERAGRVRGPMHPMVRLSVARAALLAANPTSARKHCSALTGHDVVYTRVRLEALLIEATAAYGMGDHPAARIAWNRAVALSEDSGLVRPLLIVPPEIRDALEVHGSVPPLEEILASRVDGPYPHPSPAVTLTEREAAVLTGIAGGDTVASVAASMFVSVNTVKTQLQSLYRKLGVHSRADAVAAARTQGLI